MAMIQRYWIIPLLAVSMTASVQTAFAGVFKCQTASGAVTYSAMPCPSNTKSGGAIKVDKPKTDADQPKDWWGDTISLENDYPSDDMRTTWSARVAEMNRSLQDTNRKYNGLEMQAREKNKFSVKNTTLDQEIRDLKRRREAELSQIRRSATDAWQREKQAKAQNRRQSYRNDPAESYGRRYSSDYSRRSYSDRPRAALIIIR